MHRIVEDLKHQEDYKIRMSKSTGGGNTGNQKTIKISRPIFDERKNSRLSKTLTNTQQRENAGKNHLHSHLTSI